MTKRDKIKALVCLFRGHQYFPGPQEDVGGGYYVEYYECRCGSLTLTGIGKIYD